MPCCFHAERPDTFRDLDPGCQFEVSADRLVEFPNGSGKHWCDFHLPFADSDGTLSTKQAWTVEKADQFLQKIYKYVASASKSDRVVDLTGVVFPASETQPLPLTSDRLFHAVCLYRAVFGGSVNFRHTKFLLNIDFSEATFIQTAYFDDIEAHGLFVARNVEFVSDAYFQRAEFHENALFSRSNFQNAAYFSGAQFSKMANFTRSNFSGSAWFDHARFYGNSGFSGNLLDANNRGLSNVPADQLTEQAQAAAFGHVWFRNAKFYQDIDFSNRSFSGYTDFNSTTYQVAPNFHGSLMNQDTSFLDSKFFDRSGERAARSYRTLKLAMEGHRAWDEAGRFFAYELESRRRVRSMPRIIKLFSVLYELGSNYGLSPGRPIGCLLLFALLFSGVYENSGLPKIVNFDHALAFSIEQYVRPFAVWTSSYKDGDLISSIWKFIASLQSLLGIGLATLFILALRRRFRMG